MKPEGRSHFLTCFLEAGLHRCACSDGLRVVLSALEATMLLLVVNLRLTGPWWNPPTRQPPTGTTKGWRSGAPRDVVQQVETVLRQTTHWHAGC